MHDISTKSKCTITSPIHSLFRAQLGNLGLGETVALLLQVCGYLLRVLDRVELAVRFVPKRVVTAEEIDLCVLASEEAPIDRYVLASEGVLNEIVHREVSVQPFGVGIVAGVCLQLVGPWVQGDEAGHEQDSRRHDEPDLLTHYSSVRAVPFDGNMADGESLRRNVLEVGEIELDPMIDLLRTVQATVSLNCFLGERLVSCEWRSHFGKKLCC